MAREILMTTHTMVHQATESIYCKYVQCYHDSGITIRPCGIDQDIINISCLKILSISDFLYLYYMCFIFKGADTLLFNVVNHTK